MASVSPSLVAERNVAYRMPLLEDEGVRDACAAWLPEVCWGWRGKAKPDADLTTADAVKTVGRIAMNFILASYLVGKN